VGDKIDAGETGSDNNLDAGDASRVTGKIDAQVAAPGGSSLWTRSFVVIWFVNFLNSVVFLLLMIVMSKVATDRFAVSPAVAGLSASIFVVGSFVLRPFLGKRIHHIGQTRLLYAGTFLSLLLTLAYFPANSVGLLLLVRLLHGAAHGAALLAIGTIIAGVVSRERYGEGLAYFTLGTTVSTAIGPFIGLLVVRNGGFDPIIITCAALMALSLALLPLLRVKDPELTAEQRAETKGFKLTNYIEPRAVPVGLTLMLGFLCYSSVSSFLALYSEETGLTTAAGVFFIVYAVVIFFTRPLVGRRFDEKGENSVMYAAIVVFALGLVILAVATHGSVLLLAAAVLGLGFGTIQACGRAVTVKVTPLHRMGQATTTFYTFCDIGLGVGPLLCGLLIPVTGYRGMYGIMAAVTAASVVLYHLWHGRHAGEYAVEQVAGS
jgi:MFS family permease